MEETEKAPEVKATIKHNRILLEFLVFGVEADKKKITKMTDDLQKQMFTKDNIKRARVLWYIDKGQKTNEEKKQWLLDNCLCKYYVFTPENYHVDKKYVNKILASIKQFELKLNSMKAMGVCMAKKPKPEEEAKDVPVIHMTPETPTA